MPLILRAISLNDHPLTQPMAARFESDGGSIGRADHNTLALPDPERHISRHHAEISAHGDGYKIRNVSSANPIVVGGQPLGRGESAPLGHRDQVRIGGYLLEVIEEDASEASGAAPSRSSSRSEVVGGEAPVTMETTDCPTPASPAQHRVVGAKSPTGGTLPGAPAPVLTELKAPVSNSNPFAELLGDSAPFSETFPAAAAPPAAPPRALLPDDFDPFAAPPSRPPATTRPVGADIGTFDDLVAAADPASIDDFLGLRPGDRDPLADFMADVPAQGMNGASGTDSPHGLVGLSTDPMALFAERLATSTPSVSSSLGPDDVPEWRAAFVPPGVQAPPRQADVTAAEGRPATVDRPVAAPAVRAAPPHAQTQARPLTSAAPADPHSSWSAFCTGAGIAPDLPPGVDPQQQLHVAGTLLNAAVAGTLQLMMVRSTTKQELGADVTMIRARNNNPLKFSPDTTSALEQLLKPPLRGFLPGPAAMTDAMHDLVGHTIGTMAGTRAALEGVLDRFGPAQLEAKLAARSVLDSVLPMNRKAKLWELYLQHFDAIRNEAQEDFHALFGRAFLGAYEQQLARLRQEGEHRPDDPAKDSGLARPGTGGTRG